METVENGMAVAVTIAITITTIIQTAAIVEATQTMTITGCDRNAASIVAFEKTSAAAAIASTQTTRAGGIAAANTLTSAAAI